MNPTAPAWSIRRFLLGQPRAKSIWIHTGDSRQELSYDKRSWTKTAETIHALAPDVVELLDSDNRVIRAMRMDDQSHTTSDSAPEPPRIIHEDPETAKLTHMSNLLARAYEFSTELAFTKLVELVERMGDRADAIEARLERTEAANRRLFKEQVEDAFDRADELVETGLANGSPEQQLMGAFLQGQVAGQQGAPPPNGNGKPNGKR